MYYEGSAEQERDEENARVVSVILSLQLKYHVKIVLAL
jgi:hypothetical protein